MTTTSDFNNLTISNSSGAYSGCETSLTPSVDFNAAATISGTYTINTGDVRVEYESGATYTVTNINWDGNLVGTPIVFRNSTLASGTWTLNVSGTQTDVSYVNVGRSVATPGDEIVANNGTNTDCSNNVKWKFGQDLSGIVYTAEGSSPLDGSGVNKTVNLRIDGAGSYTDEITANDGAWAISDVPVSGGDIITIYLDDETEEGTMVYVAQATELTDLKFISKLADSA